MCILAHIQPPELEYILIYIHLLLVSEVVTLELCSLSEGLPGSQ